MAPGTVNLAHLCSLPPFKLGAGRVLCAVIMFHSTFDSMPDFIVMAEKNLTLSLV